MRTSEAGTFGTLGVLNGFDLKDPMTKVSPLVDDPDYIPSRKIQ